MILKEWMYHSGETYATLSKGTGYRSRANLCRVANGQTPAGKKLALLIEAYTKGSVTRDEVMFPQEYDSFATFKNVVLPNKSKTPEVQCKNIPCIQS